MRSLTNRAYIREHYFNKYEKRGGDVRRMTPRAESVSVKVLSIVAGDLLGLEREVAVTIPSACCATGCQLSYVAQEASQVRGLCGGDDAGNGQRRRISL